MNDDFKVTYTNHSKAYVPKLSGTDVYRSYLNLLPEDEEKDEVDESKKSQISEERKKILGTYLIKNTPIFTNKSFVLDKKNFGIRKVAYFFLFLFHATLFLNKVGSKQRYDDRDRI